METVRVVVLPIAKYLFALPMGRIIQVRRYPVDWQQAELINIEGRPVVAIDLWSHLAKKHNDSLDPHISETLSEKFLVLTHQGGELFALKVDRLPDMMDIDRAHIQPLPMAYRQNQLAGLAKHVAIVPTPDRKLVIFLLDLAQVGILISDQLSMLSY